MRAPSVVSALFTVVVRAVVRAVVGIVVIAGGAACSTTTTIRTSTPSDAKLIVDDHDYGVVGSGQEVEVAAGFEPLHWTLIDGGQIVAEGDIDRDQVSWGIVVGAGAAAACCVPTMAVTGFCIANPALLVAPIAILVNPGLLVTTCQAPGWLSVPFTAIGAGVGSAPLFLGLLGQHPPPEVTLTAPSRLPSRLPLRRPAEPTSPLPSAPSAPSAPPTPQTPSEPLPPESRAQNPLPLAWAPSPSEAMCF
jgi:hypothetical protein